MAKTYIVKALAVIANIEGGITTLLHRGAVLPENVDPTHLQHLVDNDLVEEGAPIGGLAPAFAVDPTAPAVVEPVAEVDDVDGPDGPIPPKSADKGTWVEFAVTKGADRAEAEASTKDDLIAAYGQA